MPTFEEPLAVASVDDFAAWLAAHGAADPVCWVIIHKKATGKQTVTFDALLEMALRHGWVDVQTKGVDSERYAIRFVPRRPGSNWSAANRAIVKRLLAEGRMSDAGRALLPPDLLATEEP